MPPTRVLIIDDSTVVRTVVSGVFADHPEITVETARNGRAGLDAIARRAPDIVLLDIEMPVLDGLSTLRELRQTNTRLPVIMFSTLTERGATVTLEALAAGANDYLPKPSGVSDLNAARERLRHELLTRIEALCGAARRPRPAMRTAPAPAPVAPVARTTATRGSAIDLIAIGCSTGGPNALAALLPSLPGDLRVPIVVVQHMPEMFTNMLAKSLDAKSRLHVAEGRDGVELRAGDAWIAPGGKHMTVQRRGALAVLGINEDPPENSCRPAVDVLFRSVAASYGPRALAVVLTGMGADGCAGGAVIRDAGGAVIAQDEATSVVWGMPGAVTRAGLADVVLPLEQIGDELQRRLQRRSPLTVQP